MILDQPTATQQAVQGILQRLDVLASKMGTTANKIWEIYLLQGRVVGIQDLVLAIVFSIVSLILLTWVRAAVWEKAYDSRFYREGWTIAAILAVAVGCVLGGIALSCLYDVVAELINPAYWALHQIFNDIK